MAGRVGFVWAAALMAACGGDAETPAALPDSTGYGEADVRPVPAAWMVSPEGTGPVRVGMTMAELAPYLAASDDTVPDGGACAYVQIAGAPEGLAFMVEGGRLVRVDVQAGMTATAEGVQVGDAEARVFDVYPAAERRPHKYTDGAYLVVRPGAPADTLGRYVFETDGTRVTEYRAGEFPAVEYVEGCG